MPRTILDSERVKYSSHFMEADYKYETTDVLKKGNVYKVIPKTTDVTFKTDCRLPKLGVMLVGWGGNNGSTLTAAIIANRLGLSWATKDGVKSSNYFGSVTQCSTVCLGTSPTEGEVYVRMRDLLPMVEPDEISLDGWDISSLDLAASMERAQVLDFNLQQQLKSKMSSMHPRASIFDQKFVADNQVSRADNILTGTRQEMMDKIREDIRDFRFRQGLDKVIILWTANTECFSEVEEGLNDTSENLLKSIKENSEKVAPSTLFAVASILEGCAYINGSPQNTFVPGCIQLAIREGVFIAGDDFKSGQTKLKSVLVDFLVGAGIKPVSIVSYNHLGNNDGKNLSAPAQFRSKEISKSNVVDDMVASNQVLYKPGEKPDHCVVIKYVPYVGDSKRAMDEYTSEIMLGGHNTIVIHNTCQDSLLASPLILDLIILTELCQRITFRVGDLSQGATFQSFHSVLSILSYLCKAPLVPDGAPVVNALFKQRACIENLLRACLGLGPLHHIGLEFKSSDQTVWKGKASAKKISFVDLNGERELKITDFMRMDRLERNDLV